MVTFNFKTIQSGAKCQNFVEGHKAVDGEILAFYVRNRKDIKSITKDTTSGLYDRLLNGNGVYLLFKEDVQEKKQYVYVGKSTKGIIRCDQHINKVKPNDARMYDYWESVIYFMSDDDDKKEWSLDNITDLERLFISFFSSDKNKWISLNSQKGSYATSDIKDLNTKIVAILSFIKEDRFGFKIDHVNSASDMVNRCLEEFAKSAIEIRQEAEEEAKQEFKLEILKKYGEEALKSLEFTRRVKKYEEFKGIVKGSSNYIMYGRIYNSKRDKKDQDVITPKKVSYTTVYDIPAKYFSGNIKVIDIATKSGYFICDWIDRLMSDDPLLPINSIELKEEWNKDKLSRLKRIISYVIHAIAVSYEGYLITCENIFKTVDKYLAEIGTVSIFDSYTEIPNVKYKEVYMNTVRSKGKNKGDSLLDVIKSEFGDDMKFDIVIGNPPYQDGTKSIYPEFIDLALKMKPKYIAMITRNNWLTSETLKDTRNKIIDAGLTKVVNYPISGEVFDNVGVSVCIFCIEDGYKGKTKIIEVKNGNIESSFETQLNKNIVILCSGTDYNIIHKILKVTSKSYSEHVGSNEYFRINSNLTVGRGDTTYTIDCSSIKTAEYNTAVMCMEGRSIYYTYIKQGDIPAKKEVVDQYKIVCGKILLKSGKGKESIITNINGLKPNEICSASFTPIFMSNNQVEAYNAYLYIKSKLFRYLVMLMIDYGVIGVSPFRFSLVPDQNFTSNSDIDWQSDNLDKILYDKYDLTSEERKYIDEIIK